MNTTNMSGPHTKQGYLHISVSIGPYTFDMPMYVNIMHKIND